MAVVATHDQLTVPIILEGGVLTQAKSKEIGQRPGSVVHNVELAGLEGDIPVRSVPSKGFLYTIAEV